jgi:hypothetical protein
MTLHWERKYSAELSLILGVIGLAILSAGATTWVGGNSARGDPVFSAVTGQGHGSVVQGSGQPAEPVPLTMTTSPQGDYRFLAPAAWSHPRDPMDRALEAFFVGPVDPARRTLVMMSVSRYPRAAQAISVEHIIAELEHDKTKHVLGAEPILVDGRPAHLARIHEVTSMLSKALEVLSLDLRESIVIVENGPDLLVIEYAASPELHGEYWPIFDRLVSSFQFVVTP